MKIINYSTLRDNMKTYMDAARNNETIIITRKDGNVVMISEEMFDGFKYSNSTNSYKVKESVATYSTKSDLEKEAEEVLAGLSISLENAVEMFLRQVVLRRGIPFEITYPNDIAYMSDDEIIAKIQKGLDDVENGRVMDAREALQKIKDKHGF